MSVSSVIVNELPSFTAVFDLTNAYDGCPAATGTGGGDTVTGTVATAVGATSGVEGSENSSSLTTLRCLLACN